MYWFALLAVCVCMFISIFCAISFGMEVKRFNDSAAKIGIKKLQTFTDAEMEYLRSHNPRACKEMTIQLVFTISFAVVAIILAAKFLH
jgi:hypothetical protein